MKYSYPVAFSIVSQFVHVGLKGTKSRHDSEVIIAVPHSAPEGRLRFNARHRAYKRHSQVSETVPVYMAESQNLL